MAGAALGGGAGAVGAREVALVECACSALPAVCSEASGAGVGGGVGGALFGGSGRSDAADRSLAAGSGPSGLVGLCARDSALASRGG